MKKIFILLLLFFLISCNIKSEKELKILDYTIVEKNDFSNLNNLRMAFRIILNVDKLPTKKEMKDTATYLWKNEKKLWKEFTVFLYLPEMDTELGAYGIGVYDKDGLVKFNTVDISLNGTKWEIIERKQKQTNTKSEKIICDKFYLNVDLKDNILSLSIDSDLPDFTSIIVSISRSYWAEEDTDEYPIDYFYEKSNLKKWKNTQSVVLNNSQWKTKLKERQDTMIKIGELDYKVNKISDNISVDVTVHARQPNSAFGKRNINLTGKEVTIENIHFVRKEKEFFFPYQ